MDKYIVKRYQTENFKKMKLLSEKPIPLPFTFVFGHTHKPILEEKHNAIAQVEIGNQIFPVLNTGGWNRDDGPEGKGENAGVLFIDKHGADWRSLRGKLM